MNILAIIRGLLSLVNWLAQIAHDRQLLDAGGKAALMEHANAALEKINVAQAARRAVRDAPADVLRDPNNRDGR